VCRFSERLLGREAKQNSQTYIDSPLLQPEQNTNKTHLNQYHLYITIINQISYPLDCSFHARNIQTTQFLLLFGGLEVTLKMLKSRLNSVHVQTIYLY